MSRPQAQFFLCLAALLRSGVPLLRSLEVLAEQTASPTLQRCVRQAANRLASGNRLSQALAGGPFTRFQLQLIAVGERTGMLHGIIERLGQDGEKGNRDAMRVFTALTYPVLVLAASLGLVLWSQHYVLAGLLRVIQSQGLELPWPTRVLMTTSHWLDQPALWLAGALATAFLARLLKQRQEGLRRRLFRLPWLGPAYRWSLTLAFLRAFALCQRTGVPVLQSLRLLEELDPVLQPPLSAIQARLRDGETLTEAFQACDFFPPLVSQLLSAGEESGKVAELLESCQVLGEAMLDETLETFSASLQPLAMLLVGGMVGFVLVGTLSPLLKMAQTM